MRFIWPLFVLCLLISPAANGQPVLDSGDLPQGGTTYVRANAAPPFDTGNLEASGPNLTWDYSALLATGDAETEYFPLSEASFTTQFVFASSDHFTAFELPDFGEDFALPISGATTFREFGSNAYKTVGLGITTDFLDLPVIYEDDEELLPLPLVYGATLEGTSAFTVELPEILYYSTDQTSDIEVDAWGTLLLPGGSFDCLRVTRNFSAQDSVNIPAFDTGFSIPREGTVYEWYAAGEGMPVLSVQTFADIPAVWQFKPGTSEIGSFMPIPSEWNVGPSPLYSGTNLRCAGLQNRAIVVSDLQGKRWYSGIPPCDANGAFLTTTGWPSGMFLIQDLASGQSARVILH